MLEDTAEEVIPELSQTETARIFGRIAVEKIFLRFEVVERHVEMRSGPGAFGEGLGHEGRDEPFFRGILASPSCGKR